MNKWPKSKEIKNMSEDTSDWSLGPGTIQSPVQKIKYDICSEFVAFKREHRLNQRELAQKLEISEILVSKILRYRFDEFTIDRLVRYLEKLEIRYEFRRTA